jgi:two-component system chemotaxis sensor kinase CheA
MSISEREKEFLKRLKVTFKTEAQEHINAIASGLLDLEKGPGKEKQDQILETIYRQVHSLKGSARAVDLNAIETICQSLESIFKEFKYREIPSSPRLFDILQQAMDTIDALISTQEEIDISGIIRELAMIQPDQLEVKPGKIVEPSKADSRSQMESPPQGKRFTRQGCLTPAPEKEKPIETTANTIRIPTEKLDRLLLQAEEMIFMKLAINRRMIELKEMIPLFTDLEKKREVVTPILKSLQRKPGKGSSGCEKVLEYFEYSDTRQRECQSKINRVSKALEVDQRIFAGMVNSHLEDIRKTLMLPFSTLTESFPRMVRDLARQKEKEIELVIKGQEIEIDKRILEEMKSPLIHLVRNAVDHGIEAPGQRTRWKKPGKGLVMVIISQQEGNKVEILVSDDGIGIDLEKVKAKAISTGLVSAEEIERLAEQEILSLIFNSEFSTSPIITDLSGRGLGLAIAREKVEKLGGQITLESKWGQGTTFRILLQATLATFRGILVESAKQKFIIPTLNVEKVLRIHSHYIKTVQNRETIKVGNDIISYVRLEEVLQLPVSPSAPNSSKNIRVVILAAGDKRIAFQVDDVLDEEEVLVKDLGKQLSRVKNIAGATVLGSGEIVPILNVVDLIKSAVAAASTAPSRKPSKAPDAAVDKKSILVVEDSITSRMLLKNILETGGYRVRVAVDGMDGWIAVKEGKFDLVVSDVDMPGMNGFELTEKIRQDKNLEELPVVLVTAMESREDREKGIDVGAEGYIVKSSFDQSNLLDVIKKLI